MSVEYSGKCLSTCNTLLLFGACSSCYLAQDININVQIYGYNNFIVVSYTHNIVYKYIIAIIIIIITNNSQALRGIALTQTSILFME